ncbi:DNA-binding transcriptional regulator, GntR family [Aliiroseovarius halocynthiae]|nr:GntR family transcriptional regulator [Aliiroseovarius halocynthiae]SMR70856.1 DNA-binding transcriptional regulator, GntR family [Aliiroseovarius halocynthiae]
MKVDGERKRVAASLEKDIVFGHLKPRERLVEQDLMDRFEARRHIVRAALESLEQKGLVERRANKGAAVRDLSLHEIDELYFMRELLHRAAAEQTPLPLPGDVLAELRQIQAKHDAAIQKNDLTDAFHQNESFHIVLNHACGNSVLEEALNLYNERTNLVRSVAFRSIKSLRRSSDEHYGIIDAGAKADRAAFVDAVVKHILGAKASFLASNAAK